ncbi:TetR family transcriptional regulator [Microbacterium sp. CH12i]|uniref:TetR/AcrR family transcriptional regulator n=1 Tax=Microbacterium sp. CH12i TaxID=1479651 RepID=UPI000460FFF3|nr:TetR/AcrR family transcriptional regulator [Microbacterium sp. CH12i]KDA05371.1 TetR family transcriptional regulator [Microbacterium sp. CH12i]
MNSDQRPPRRDAILNRERLIQSARDVFAELGVDAPLDIIARRAGLTNATLYRHFPVRSNLLLETFRLTLRRHDRTIHEALAMETGWIGFEYFLRWEFAEHQSDASLSHSLLSVRAGSDTEVDGLRLQTLDGIEALMDQAKAEGALRRDRWLDDVLVFFEANARLVASGGTGPQAASDRLLELALDSFSASPPDRGEVEPASVLLVRRAFVHRLHGEPRDSDDL